MGDESEEHNEFVIEESRCEEADLEVSSLEASRVVSAVIGDLVAITDIFDEEVTVESVLNVCTNLGWKNVTVSNSVHTGRSTYGSSMVELCVLWGLFLGASPV